MDAIMQQQDKTTKLTPFSPDNVDQAMRLCDMLAKSALVPQAVRGKPADIFVILATGRELGIGPMQALSDINVIQGKPVFSADLMIAQCKRRSDVCQYIRLVESTDTAATYETQRVGAPAPERFTFTLEDARKMGLAGKDNWQKQPKTMLRRRAGAALAREVYPDLVRGYDPDEAADFAPPVRVAVAPQPVEEPAAILPSTLTEPDNTQRAAEAIVEQVEAVTAQAMPEHVKPLFDRILRQAEPKGPGGTHTAEQVAYAMKLMADAASAILSGIPMETWTPPMVRALTRHFFGAHG